MVDMGRGLGSIVGTIDVKKLLNVGSIVGSVIVIAIICLVILWVVFYILKFNKKILLIELTTGQMRFSWDKGWKNKKKKEFTALSHRNVDFIYPDSLDECPMGRGTILPYVVINQQAAPIKGVSLDSGEFILADMNMFNHLVARLKQNEELTRGKMSFWDKYGKDILLAAMITILFVSIIFILKRVDRAIEMGQAVIGWSQTQTTQVIQGAVMLGILKRRD